VRRSGLSNRTIIRHARNASHSITGKLIAGRWYFDPATVPEPMAEPDPAGAATPGMELVPVDLYRLMLDQLGNLHEAGRDLAEARERAARAETEAQFLRTQLQDLRERAVAEAAPSAVPPPAEASPRRRWWQR